MYKLLLVRQDGYEVQEFATLNELLNNLPPEETVVDNFTFDPCGRLIDWSSARALDLLAA